jgi:acetyl esterase/lipase
MIKARIFTLLGLLFIVPPDVFAYTSDQQHTKAEAASPWRPSFGLTQVPIWPSGAPNMTDAQKNSAPETATERHKVPGQDNVDIANVTVPTITVYPPKGKNSGASIVVFPGGGFRILAMGLEGTEICNWISSKGITCVLLKYRVPKGNHYWDSDCNCHVTPPVAWALQDSQRAIRIVRARANELHIDPHRIGVMGFSSGGYLVIQTSNIFESTYKRVDPADDMSSRPDFAIALYPGHLCKRTGEVFDQSFKVTDQTPPTFLLQAWDDPVDNICNSTLYARALAVAGVPSEVHLFAKGGHAFALRHQGDPVSSWPLLVENWLKVIEVLKP